MKDEKTPDKDQFRVVDLRRFGEAEDEHSPAEGLAPEPPPSAAAGEQAVHAAGQDSAGPAEDDEHAFGEDMLPPPDFSNFVISLATQALVMLGEVPHPETNLVAANFPAAKQTIDILAMLEEKTKGNLNQEEEHLLGEVLATLRLAFVQKLGGPGPRVK